MGLLDELKREAEEIRTLEKTRNVRRQEKSREVEVAIDRVERYVAELLQQLAVIKPVSPTVYAVPGVGEMRELRFVDSHVRVDRKGEGDANVLESFDFFIRWASNRTMTIDRDMPAEIERMRELLGAANLKFDESSRRDSNGMLLKTAFAVAAQVMVTFTVRADHEHARLLFYGRNAVRLGAEDYVVPAAEVGEALLEDFAKMLLGKPNTFRRFATVLGA